MMEGIIMVLGTMMGLSVTNNKFILLLGVWAAGLSDSFANAAGILVSQETERHHSRKEVRKSTILCFFSTLAMVILLSIPLVFFKFSTAVVISETIGLVLLGFLGYVVGKIRKVDATRQIIKYVAMGVVVSAITFGLGELIKYISMLG